MADVREQLQREARDAAAALPALSDDSVTAALGELGVLLRERAAAVLAANRADVGAAEGRLDAGALDRLRLDDARLAAIGGQVRELAALPALERDVAEWTADGGLHVRERRIP